MDGGGENSEQRTADKAYATPRKSSGFSNSRDRTQKPFTFHYTKNESSDEDSDSLNQSVNSYFGKNEDDSDATIKKFSEQTNGSGGIERTPSTATVSSAPLLDDKKDDTVSLASSQNGSIASSPPIMASSHLQQSELSHSSSGSKLSQVELEKRRNSELVTPKYALRCEELRKSFKGIYGERLICDYSCALQREILIQGRLYITANWLCFKSKLLVWHTSVTIRFADITSLVKDKTALIIPNAISVIANDEKYFFTSFATRDKVFDLLQQLWKVTTTGQALSNEEIWQLVLQNYTTVATPEQGVEENKVVELKPVDKNESAAGDSNSSEGETSSQQGDSENQTFISAMVCQDKTGEIHSHEGKTVLDTTYPVSLNQLCEMIFTDSSVFADYAKTQTMTDVQIGTWNTCAHQPTSKERAVKYNITVKVHVGVRNSTMIERQMCELMTIGENGQSVVHVDSECRSKGVPYCDSFVVCNHYCVTSLAPKQTRLTVYSEINYTKSVWGVAKGFIERNVHQGLSSSFSFLDKCLKKECVKLSRQVSGDAVEEEKSIEQPPDVAIAADEVLHVTKEMPRVTAAEPSVWLGMQTICFVLLVLVLCSHFVMFYRLLALESSALVPQYCPGQGSCSGANAAPTMTVNEWASLLEKQQQQHELEMEAWKSLLQRSLQMANNVHKTYAALHDGHSFSSQAENDDLTSTNAK